ncbi:MAG: hypothetical protein ACOCWR_00075 [Oceanidesulfovibrio sp.]
MFKPERVIIAAIVVALLCLAGVLLSMVGPDTRGGKGADTFGVRRDGLRGMYETVEATGFEVRRGFGPPHAAVAEKDGAGWLVLWRPDPNFVFRDERFLDELGGWVESGGAVLFAPEFDPEAYFHTRCECEEDEADAAQNGTTEDKDLTVDAEELEARRKQRDETRAERQAKRFHVLEPLRRMGVGVARLGVTDYAGRMERERESIEAYRERKERERRRDNRENGGAPRDESPPAQVPHKPIDPNTTAWSGVALQARHEAHAPAEEYDWFDYRRFLASFALEERAGRAAARAVIPRGELGSLWQGLETVAIPDETQVLLPPEEDEPEPDGVLALEAHNGTTAYLAAAYRKGEGLVVVVADPVLFINAMLAEPGAAYTALGPLHRAGVQGAVVFDEFFHGLSVRGRPMWLLTRRPYGLVALALILAVAMWCWRSGSRLGPPLPPVEPTRRTVDEYLEAMSGLFLRGDKQAFLAQELKAGALWWLGRRHRLGYGRENLEAVTKAMARRDPDEAERLENAVHELETLAAQRKPPIKRLVAAARELTRCL